MNSVLENVIDNCTPKVNRKIVDVNVLYNNIIEYPKVTSFKEEMTEKIDKQTKRKNEISPENNSLEENRLEKSRFKKDKSEDSEDEDKPEDDIDPSELFKGL